MFERQLFCYSHSVVTSRRPSLCPVPGSSPRNATIITLLPVQPFLAAEAQSNQVQVASEGHHLPATSHVAPLPENHSRAVPTLPNSYVSITYTDVVHTPSWTTQVSRGTMARSFPQRFMICSVLLLALSLFYGCGAGGVGNSQLSSLAMGTPAKLPIRPGGKPYPVASPMISVDPSTLPFGNTNLGSSNVQFVTVSNTGSSNLVISQSTASGNEFSILGLDAPLTIAAGQSSRFVIRFAPTVAGGATGNISLVSNAQNSPTAIALSGSGLASAPTIRVDPPSLAFGDQNVGASSARAVTISNTGSKGLVISQATITGNGFSISGLTAPLTIARGESKSFNVNLLPAAAGDLTGRITLVGNGANLPATIALAGSGVQPPTKTPVDVASVQSTPPELLVKTSGDDVAHVYSTYTKISSTQFSVSDSVINATL